MMISYCTVHDRAQVDGFLPGETPVCDPDVTGCEFEWQDRNLWVDPETGIEFDFVAKTIAWPEGTSQAQVFAAAERAWSRR